jgi:hypothetical protein
MCLQLEKYIVSFPLISQWEKETSHTQLYEETVINHAINNDIIQLRENAAQLS